MTGGVLRGRPSRMVLLAVILIVAGIMLGPARDAFAYTFSLYSGCCGKDYPRDSDGNVPESEGAPSNGHYDRILGYTYAYSTSSGTYTAPNVTDYIKYDWVEMRRCNATSSERDALIRHERAHSRGWGHYEDPSSLNAAYSRYIAGVVCPA